MSHQSLAIPAQPALPEALPLLESGDHLDQPTFHKLYGELPETVKAELIGGIVFMPSPLKRPHGKMHLLISRWVSEYEDVTPGTEAFDNATVVLGPESEPQPDIHLVISAGAKGQTKVENEYTVGAPELVLEIASFTHSIDLHRKKDDYSAAGVKEYVVVALHPAKVYWFVLHEEEFQELSPNTDGIFQSRVFPGLWLDPTALLALDRRRVLQALQRGLATPEHAAFVAALQ